MVISIQHLISQVSHDATMSNKTRKYALLILKRVYAHKCGIMKHTLYPEFSSVAKYVRSQKRSTNRDLLLLTINAYRGTISL